MDNSALIGLASGISAWLILVLFIFSILMFCLPFFVLKIRNTVVTIKTQLDTISENLQILADIQMLEVSDRYEKLPVNIKPQTKPTPKEDDARFLKQRKADLELLSKKYGMK